MQDCAPELDYAHWCGIISCHALRPSDWLRFWASLTRIEPPAWVRKTEETNGKETDPLYPDRASARHHRWLGKQCRDRRRNARERRAAQGHCGLPEHRH